MTTPSDYLAARKRVEADLRTAKRYSGGRVVAHEASIRAILNPPAPTVEEVARVILQSMCDGDDVRAATPESTANAAREITALFTTPDPST